jgi:hypothetical protein
MCRNGSGEAMRANKARRATPADANAVRDLSRAAYAKWVPLIGREPLPMTADYDRAIANHIIDLLEDDGQLLALIEMIEQEDHLLVENIAVRPDQKEQDLVIGSSGTLKELRVRSTSRRCVCTRTRRLRRTSLSTKNADTKSTSAGPSSQAPQSFS